MIKIIPIIIVLLYSVASKSNVESEIKKTMVCSMAKYAENQMNCKYKIGSLVEIEIAGVGQKMANVYFAKISGGYHVSFLINSQCVSVSKTKGVPDLIFISVKDGKLYKSAQACPSIK